MTSDNEDLIYLHIALQDYTRHMRWPDVPIEEVLHFVGQML